MKSGKKIIEQSPAHTLIIFYPLKLMGAVIVPFIFLSVLNLTFNAEQDKVNRFNATFEKP